MYDERNNWLLLGIEMNIQYLCLKHEKMSDEMRDKIWNDIKRHINGSRSLALIEDGD